MDAVARKGWTQITLARLGVVVEDDGRYRITTSGGVLHYADDGRKRKMLADAGTERVLWPAPEEVAGDMIVVVEGEPDAITATELGLPVVGVPGAGKADPTWPKRLAAGRRHVYLFADSDSVGRARMRRLAEQMPDVFAYVIDLAPERDDGYDISDVVADFGVEHARRIVAQAMERAAPFEAPPPAITAKPAEREFVETRMSDVLARPLDWLWRPYIPLGKVSLVVGAPGHGKSQFTAWLAASITRAVLDLNAAGDVLGVFAEDDLADTVVPRLMAAEADLRRVYTINAREQVGFNLTADGLITLPGDVGVLYEHLQRHPETRLVIFDPVMSYLGREYKGIVNQDVRAVLSPLKALAEHFGVAIVCILHVNKQSEIHDWSARISDSHAWQAVARSIVALGPDPDDEEGDEGSLKVLALPKSNLAKRVGRSMRFEIESRSWPSDDGRKIETSRILPTGLCDVSADDLLMNNEQRSTTREAREWLIDFLGDEWHKTGELITAAIKDGYSKRTLDRVRPSICQTKKQQGVRNGPTWIALKTTRTLPPWTQGTGNLGDVDADQDANDANVARTQCREGQRSPNGASEDRQDRQEALDLADYRRERDRRLGERDDDGA